MAKKPKQRIRFSGPKLAGERMLPGAVSAWLSVHKELKTAIADLVAGRAAYLEQPHKDKLYLYFCLDEEAGDMGKEAGPRRIMRAALRLSVLGPRSEKKRRRMMKKIDGAADAVLGALLFERDIRGLNGAAGTAPASQARHTKKVDEALLLARVRKEIKAGKWKSDNCGTCPYRYLNEGRIKTIGEMLTDKRVKKKTCGRCPSRPLLAGIGK